MKKRLYISVMLLMGSIMSAFPISSTIGGGAEHALIICAKGEVYAWGNNGNNKLALNPNPGSTVTTPRRVNLPAGVTFSQVISGPGGHTLALSCNKTVYAFGDNDLSQCGGPVSTAVTTPRLIPKGATPGYNLDGTPGGDYLGAVKYVMCSCGGSFAILNTGEMVGWGGNCKGGGVGGAWISASAQAPVYIKYPDGTNVKNVIHIDAGDNNIAILVENPVGSGLGTVYTIGAWDGRGGGSGATGYTAQPVLRDDNKQPLTNIRMVCCSTVGGSAVDVDGYVWGWGDGWGCSTGSGSPDGNLYAMRVVSGAYSTISGEEFLTDVKDIAGGRAFTIAVTKEGYVVSWGSGAFGPNSGLGCADIRFLNYPGGVRVTDAVHVGSGDLAAYMVNDKNEFYSIGGNGSGQLGIGNTTAQTSFMKINIPCLPIDPCPEVFMPQQVNKCPDKPIELNTGFIVPEGIELRYYFKWSHDGNVLNTSTIEEAIAYRKGVEEPEYEPCGCEEVCDEGDDICMDACLEACDPKPLPPPPKPVDPFNRAKISVTESGIYTVEAEYIGVNIPCDACEPAIGTIKVVDMEMMIDVMPVTSCVEDPVNPKASDNVCFKFESKYRTIESNFDLYPSETGGGAPLQSFNFTATGPKDKEFCVTGDKVGVVANPPRDTVYTIWLEDKTLEQGTLMNTLACTGSSAVSTTGVDHTLQITVYENMMLNSFSVNVASAGAGATLTPVIYPVSATKCNTYSCPNTAAGSRVCTGTVKTAATGELVLEFNDCILEGSARGMSYFVGLIRSGTSSTTLRTSCNRNNFQNDVFAVNGTYRYSGYSATETQFYNFKFSKLSSYTCGRMKLTSKYYCPPCVRPDIQDGKRVEIIPAAGAKREGAAVLLCAGESVELTLKQLKFDEDNPNTRFDVLWYQAANEAEATSPLKETPKVGTDTYTVTAWTNNTNEVQTRRYYVKVQDTDKKSAAECWEWDHVDIKVSPNPTLTNTPLTETVCSENSRNGVVLTSNITNATTTYSWTTSVTGGITVNSSSGTGNLPGETLINNGDAPGTVTYRITPSVNGCDGTPVNYTVTVNPKAEITLTSPTATANQIICENNNITDITYSLTGGAKSATVAGLPTGVTYGVSGGILTITGKPSVTGEYNYTVTTTGHDAPCAAATATGRIAINSNPTVVPVGNKTFCADDNVSITFSSPATGATFEWQNNNTAIGLGTSGNGNISFKATNSTGTPVTGTVTVTPTAGCVGTPETFTITVNPKPIVTITNNPATNTLTCSESSITLTATGGGTYAWSGGLGNNATATVNAAGTYTVTVTANGCSDTKSVTITADKTPPVANITYSETVLTCDRPTISLTATGGGTYAWSGGLGNNATVTVNAAGTYTVTVTAANGCTAEKSVTITTDGDIPTIVITPDPATTVLTCKIPSISLTATGGASYTWSNGATGATITVTAADNYTVTATAANGCTGAQSIQITTDQSLPNVSVNDAEICLGGEATLTASGADSYTWSTGETGATITVSPTAATSYTVEGTVTETGCKKTATTAIRVETPIGLTLDAPKSVELGNELTITVSAERTDHGSFEWFINDQPYKIISEYNLTLIPDAGRQHFLVHTATAKLNCPSSSEIFVEVSESVPNIINPYIIDSKNCCFMRGYHVEIYNRYMQKVFEGDNGWDGTYRGALADPGTYFYRLHKKGGQVEKGTLEVVKF